MDTIQHLVVNQELYSPTFATSNHSYFELIQNRVQSIIPKSKMKEYHHHTLENAMESILVVYKEYYQYVLDDTRLYLQQNNIDNEIFWFNMNGITFPCGYYQVGAASLSNGFSVCDSISKIAEYLNQDKQNFQDSVFIQYDYLANLSLIALKGSSYEKLVSDLNQFILKNGLGPMKQISLTSSVGEVVEKNYPFLSKRK